MKKNNCLFYLRLLIGMALTFFIFYSNVDAANKDITVSWYTSATHVGYWETDPKTFFTNCSSAFDIASYANNAVSKWTSGGVSSSITTTPSNATMKFYGGTRAELNLAGFYYNDNNTYGLTYWDTYYSAGTANKFFDVYKITAASISMCSETDSLYRSHVALHEYGHALGWGGHSDSVKDVMYFKGDTTVTTLSESDINQLTQVYNAMR